MTRLETKTIARTPGPPSAKALQRGSAKFIKLVGRDALYNSATLIVDKFWGQHDNVADGLGVLLEVWNKTFYRFQGGLDYDALEACLRRNHKVLDSFRHRNILDYEPSKDDRMIKRLFEDFLEASRTKKTRARCAVAVSKTFHVVAPGFFPLWDVEIAKGYRCSYGQEPAEKYLCFMTKIKEVAERFADQTHVDGKTLLKLIDEFNFMHYTIPAKRRKGTQNRQAK